MKKKTPISKEKSDRLAAKAIARLSTEAGQAGLKVALDRAKDYIDELREHSRVDLAMMKTPFGPRTKDGLWPHQLGPWTMDP
jgi:hypothetical protein